MKYRGLLTGFLCIALLQVLGSPLAVAASGEEKHMHGADGRHVAVGTTGGASGSIILSHHDLNIKDASGKTLDNCNIHSALYHKGESEPIHREHNAYEPENGVYGTHLTYEEPGEYRLVEWITMPDKSKVTVEFPVWVYPAQAEGHHDASSFPTSILGAFAVIGAVAGSYILGKKHGRARSTLASLLVAVIVMQPAGEALAAKEAHMHGADGRHLVAPSASGEAGPKLKAYPTPNKKESVVKEQDGHTFTLSIENEDVKPDPDVVSIDGDTADAIGLQVEEARSESAGGGLITTGRVVADPNGVVAINARVSGRIDSAAVTPRHRVNAGQVLFVISSSEIADAKAELNRKLAEQSEAQAAISKAQSDVNAAELRVASAKRVLARQQKLAQAGLFASAPVEKARATASTAEGEFRKANAALTYLESQEKRLQEGAKAGVIARRELEAAQASAEQGRTRGATAEEQVEIAKSALSREERIQAQGLRDSKEVHRAEADVDLANAGLISAKSELAQAKARLARTASNAKAARAQLSLLGASAGGGSTVAITSPIAGEVRIRPVNSGQAVITGDLLCEIINTKSVWVESDIYEKDLNRISVGQSVLIAVEGVAGKQFRGTVNTIGLEVNPESRSVRVRTVVSNADGLLKPNMYVRVAIAASGSKTVSVPSSAIQDDGGMQIVFVEDAPGVYRRKPVRVGTVLGDRTIVEEGLKDGDKVVTQGSYQLIAKVKGT